MRLLFTLFLCTLSVPLFAQYQTRPAELTDRNDKVSLGFIRFYDWDKSPEFIEFAEDSTGIMRSLPIRDIQKISIKGGPVYQGLYLKVPYYTKNSVQPGTSLVDRTDSTYYLTELLLESEPIKFYRFFDDDKSLRFVIAKYDSLVLLENIHVRLAKRESTYYYEDPVYRKTLKAILAECPTLNTNEITYTENSLISLLKQYLSFCRIDSKIYLEQRRFGKAIIGVGAFGSTWQMAEAKAVGFGVSTQILLPRRLHNIFVLLDIGKFSRVTSTGSETALQLGIYGGRYFGQQAIQGKIYTGLSTLLGALDTGLGISYRKMISAEVRYPVFVGLFSGFRETDTFYLRPLVNFRLSIPLTKPD